jgi:hypothetical protein
MREVEYEIRTDENPRYREQYGGTFDEGRFSND